MYKIVLADQRGCGRSRPLVERKEDLEVNTTAHLVKDLERLREHLKIDRWTLLGGSWGTMLALAYAQALPDRVAAVVLACVTTTSRREVQWITRDMGRIFPEQWDRFAALRAYDGKSSMDLADLYAELAFDANPLAQQTAAREWCAWEDTHISLSPGCVPNRRFEDPFRSLFMRLVTRYWRHAAFLDEDQLVHNASLLSDIPGVLLHGRYDISSPLETAWRLHQAWRGSELHIIDSAGHGDGAMPDRIAGAMNHVALVL
jgi:proline iminopeptidase